MSENKLTANTTIDGALKLGGENRKFSFALKDCRLTGKGVEITKLHPKGTFRDMPNKLLLSDKRISSLSLKGNEIKMFLEQKLTSKNEKEEADKRKRNKQKTKNKKQK